MTCIVGLIEKEKVYIGGDSAGVSHLDVTVRKDPKVFKIDNFVIGCTSSFRMIQLIRFSFKPPKRHPDKDVFEYMCTDFINTLRQCFREGGFIQVDKNVDNGGTFLVGYCGRLFVIFDDFQVSESYSLFASVGCGESYALGALLNIDKKLPATEKIKIALETAVYFSGGVRPPFVIEHT